MVAYINVDTGEYPRHIGDLQLLYPGITEENIPSVWMVVSYQEPPAINWEIQTAYEIPPIFENGNWIMQWAVRDLTEEEMKPKNNVYPYNGGSSVDLDKTPGSAPDVI